jgi:NADPH:quinone reductase-like Zn-dependent oxidoreductase
MRAAVHDRYGPPDVLRLEDVEQPVPNEDEVLVRIHATTVNRTDCGLRSADLFITRFITGLRRPKRKILGMELAGEVDAVGAAVTSPRTATRTTSSSTQSASSRSGGADAH